MKTRFPSILGVFAAILMVASFVIPVNIAAPSAVSADPGIMKWDTISTPNQMIGKNDILNAHGLGANTGQGSEILSMAVGNDGMTVAAVVRTWIPPGDPAAASALNPYQYVNVFYYSNTLGIAFTITRWTALIRRPNWPNLTVSQYFGGNLFQVAIAPDDPKFMAVTADHINQFATTDTDLTTNPGPKMIWVTTDAGQNWDLAYDGAGGGTNVFDLGATETIRALDISIDYGGKRDIGFVTANAIGSGARWFVRASNGFTGWLPQLNADGTAAGVDTALTYDAIKFSPTYNGDSAVVSGLLHRGTATYFQVALRDLNQNTTLQYAYGAPGIEVKNPASPAGIFTGRKRGLNNVCLQLPSDFSGQSSSLRRAYVSLDAFTLQHCPLPPAKLPEPSKTVSTGLTTPPPMS